MASSRERTDARPAHEILRQEGVRILDFLAHRGAGNVRVFGSVARGEATARSDIDLLVEFPHAGSVGEELLTVLGLSEELSELLGVRVHVVTPRTLRAPVCELALAEAVPL
jgi:predicted nucleotidyltransferase